MIGSQVIHGLTTPRVSAPPVGVTRYFDGLRAWDAHTVWSSYSADYQQTLQEEGTSEQATASLYQSLRQQGASIDEVSYVGGYQTSKSGYFLYVTRHFATNEPPTEVVWVFQTDNAGLIDSID
jgi:hypothetical protein